MLLTLPALTIRTLVTSHIDYVHLFAKDLAAPLLACGNHMNVNELEVSFSKSHYCSPLFLRNR
jgi:hypothetical protein